MKTYLRKYVPSETYVAPGGAIMDAARVQSDFPAAYHVPFVVQTDRNHQVMLGMYNLGQLLDRYDIPVGLTEEEELAALEAAMDRPPEEPVRDPSAEERIAAVLEYQMMASMPDAMEV